MEVIEAIIKTIVCGGLLLAVFMSVCAFCSIADRLEDIHRALIMLNKEDKHDGES